MRKALHLFIYLCLCGFKLMAQNVSAEGAKTGQIPSKYERVAISVMVLEGTEFSNDIITAVKNVTIPSKFDDNNIPVWTVNAPKYSSNIKEALDKNKIANQIVAKWFSRNPETGVMDMSVIHERGMYNATDDEVRRASASKIGLANLKDAGESLIHKSFVVVLDFSNIQTMDQIYDKRDAAKKAAADLLNQEYKPVERNKNGWMGQVKAYLFKLSFTDENFAALYNDLWIYEDDPIEVKQQKKAKFDQTDFPISFIMETSGEADGSQFNPGHILAPVPQLSKQELFVKMVNTGLGNCIFNFERDLEEFKVKAPLYGDDPLVAKIGKKEGLHTDQRYFVLEFEKNSKGETKTNRKGVIRAKKVIDNRKVATGDSKEMSTFYQTAGFNLEPGMLLRQQNDLGIGISGGVSIGQMGGGFLKGEVNVTSMFGRYIDLGIPQLKVFATLGAQTKNYDIDGSEYDISFTRWEVGISKGFYFARNFSVAPFISYGGETGTNDDLMTNLSREDDDFIGTDFINLGLNGSINILHWMQLIGALNFYTPFGTAYDKERAAYSESYTEFFNNRKGMTIDLGLRVEF